MTPENELLIECRTALGYSTQGLANFLAYKEDRALRRFEKGEKPVPSLLWMVLFFMLRDAGHRRLMLQVNALIQQRRPG